MRIKGSLRGRSGRWSGGHVSYGEKLRATATYLNVQQLVPEDRVRDLAIIDQHRAKAGMGYGHNPQYNTGKPHSQTARKATKRIPEKANVSRDSRRAWELPFRPQKYRACLNAFALRLPSAPGRSPRCG